MKLFIITMSDGEENFTPLLFKSKELAKEELNKLYNIAIDVEDPEEIEWSKKTENYYSVYYLDCHHETAQIFEVNTQGDIHMKLSDLIQKIYDTKYKSECYVNPIKYNFTSYKIRIQYGDGYWGDYEFFIRDGKIDLSSDMDLLPMNEFKWLYKLWVDEVAIEDNLIEKDIY